MPQLDTPGSRSYRNLSLTGMTNRGRLTHQTSGIGRVSHGSSFPSIHHREDMLPSLKKQILSRRLKQGQTMLTKRTQMANMEFSNRVAQASQLEDKQGYSARCAE